MSFQMDLEESVLEGSRSLIWLIFRYNTDIESLSDQWVHIDSINLNEENEKEFFNSVNGSDLHYEGLRV